MTVAIASANTLESPPLSPSSIAGREAQLSERLRLAAVTERSQDITLRTREGDTVTLSMNQDTVAVYGRDGRLSLQDATTQDSEGHRMAYKGTAAESREWFGFESDREFTLTIEGDLGREEMRDIRKAMHRIHRLIGQSFGLEENTPSRRFGLTDLGTLAGIEVEVQHSRTLLAASAVSVSAAQSPDDWWMSIILAWRP